MFNEKLLDHFKNPRHAGELADATARVEVSNPVCGDVLQLAVRVDGTRIRAVGFKCRGCTTAIACASMTAEMMQDAELKSLTRITAQHLAELLGGLPEATFHGAQLAEDALHALLAALRNAPADSEGSVTPPQH